ncbi:mandelate racemase/muconate lactonizing enzyme family protein [Falsiroseomonas oryzae]|uniref:mandelate racemase/muconate lactonizing enzyme family protein n=1 Tax=Falsiroseomonas oryzae TaxID=2766473 RepID=UPI0022EA6A9F|nr:enolase C-terminal domain-like protein [Roseomonas sp. MO-31]
MSGTISIEPYVLPLAQEYRWAKGVQTERRGLLVRVEAWGAEGFGESAPPIHLDTVPEELAAEAGRFVAGLPVEAEDFLARLDARGIPPRLRCGIAAAWLSARAAASGRSLAAILAAPATPAEAVPVNGLVTEKTPDQAASRAAALHAQGYRTLKIKCWEDREADRSRVAAIRAAVPDARLRLDANEAWDPEWALEHLTQLARFGIDYAEQPIPSWRPLQEIAAFRRRSPVRVALDESATDAASLQAILAAGAADVIILKTQRAGGPDRARHMIRMAAEAGVQVTVTVSLESAIGTAVALHVASTLPQPLPDCGIPMGRFLAGDLGPMPPVEAGAVMRVPSAGPGLGLRPFTAPAPRSPAR